MRTTTVCLGALGALLISPLASAATLQAVNFFTDTTIPLNVGDCPKAALDNPNVLADGSAAKPWPACAIKKAIAAAAGGDVVLVSDGYWRVSTALWNKTKNFTLQGESTNARVVFTQTGSWLFGEDTSFIYNARISGLTFDASGSSSNYALTIKNCVGCSFTGNYVLGLANVNVAAVLFQGGASTTISSNTIMGGPWTGGAQLQINEFGLPATPLPMNRGFEVSANKFDSVGLLVIGMSNISIHDNYMVNEASPVAIGIEFVASYASIARNVSICNNTLKATSNFAVISGRPQDAGGQGSIDGLVISGNVIDSTQSYLAVNYYLASCLSDCQTINNSYDVVVSNNVLKSAWGWSTIELSGGTYGDVQNVTVLGNILTGVMLGDIHTDANTTNINSANNLIVPP
jgi:hypothetical protein